MNAIPMASVIPCEVWLQPAQRARSIDRVIKAAEACRALRSLQPGGKTWLEAASGDVELLISSLASLPCSGADESLQPLQAFHAQLLEMLEATDSDGCKEGTVEHVDRSALPGEGAARRACPSEVVAGEGGAADASSAPAGLWQSCAALPAGIRAPVAVATGDTTEVTSCMPESSSELTSGGEALATGAGPHSQPPRAVIEAQNGYTEKEAGRDASQAASAEIASQHLRLDSPAVRAPPVDASAADTDAASGGAATETDADDGGIADAAVAGLDAVHGGADSGQVVAGADVTAAAAV